LSFAVVKRMVSVVNGFDLLRAHFIRLTPFIRKLNGPWLYRRHVINPLR
jgi:hypothetical protein